MEDSEGSKKHVLKLLVPLCFDVFTIQLDFLTQSVATTLYSLIMGFFLQLLCMEKVLIANFHQFFQLFGHLVSRARSWVGVNILFERDSGVVAIIELEKGEHDAGILGIVVGKFPHW